MRTVSDNDVRVTLARYVRGERVSCDEVSLHDLSGALVACDDGEHFLVATVESVTALHASLLAEVLPLDELLKQDVLSPSQRARIDRVGEQSVTVVKTAVYDGVRERVELSELHIVTTPRFLLVLGHSGMPSGGVVADSPVAVARFKSGTRGAFYHVVERIAQGYVSVAEDLERDVEGIELQVFGGDIHAPEHIYRLGREVLKFQQAVVPFADALDGLVDELESVDDPHTREALQTKRLMRRVSRAMERAAGLRELLSEILEVNSALIAQQQNEDMKKISSWAAILVVPTLIAGIYGMNFRRMPELSWVLGYPFALAVMAVSSGLLFVVFKRRNWL
ncbi:magnesium and cobalt transport protein CorA [Timonella sp. A28]|uniref:magnesium and cobalt transport protein CorA n=1 Tax=Timonella sp. A28 TaxID=3442640 RepID=UPI003EB7784A